MPQSVFDLLGADKPQEETPSERVDRLRQMRATTPQEEAPLERLSRLRAARSGGPSVLDLIGKTPEATENTPTSKHAEPGFMDYASIMIPQPVKTTVGGIFDLLSRPVGALSARRAGPARGAGHERRGVG